MPIKHLWFASIIAPIMYIIVGYSTISQQNIPISLNFNSLFNIPFAIVFTLSLIIIFISYSYIPEIMKNNEISQIKYFQIMSLSSISIFGLTLGLWQNNFTPILILCLLSAASIFKLKP